MNYARFYKMFFHSMRKKTGWHASERACRGTFVGVVGTARLVALKNSQTDVQASWRRAYIPFQPRSKIFYFLDIKVAKRAHPTFPTRLTIVLSCQQHPFFAKNDLKVLSLHEFALFLQFQRIFFLLKTI